MDAYQTPLISLQSTLFTLLITTLLITPNYCSSYANSNDNKVTLELYYETLCPYCSKFIATHLDKLFQTGLNTITNLKLIPYGNAKVSTNGTILCQHGEYECLLNTVEACAIDAWPDVTEHFPFIYCVENLVYQGDYLQWETCFETLGLNDKPIDDCFKSEKGLQLELKYAAETNALHPPHKYVPWVVVDGQPLYDDYENFLDYICKAYGGTEAPAGCDKSVTPIRMPKWKLNRLVCYKEAMSKLSGISATLLSWIDQLIL
ncbi:reductase [Lithospermum erythrorhizon]|uniref:Reductase n=1 Tax=Lithospermum erythrorhizon TaxID=34254 RepID=A0AAV3PWN5_LITER